MCVWLIFANKTAEINIIITIELDFKNVYWVVIVNANIIKKLNNVHSGFWNYDILLSYYTHSCSKWHLII